MDNPRSVAHSGHSPSDLRAAYAGQQRGRSARRHARKSFQGLKGALMGISVGGAVVLAFCVLDHQTFYWQTGAWEAALCGLAGCLLGRAGGGPASGAILFGLAYGAAAWLRGSEYSSVKVLQPSLPEIDLSVHANFGVLGALVVCGALFGYVNSLK